MTAEQQGSCRTNTRQKLIGVGALAAILASSLWIYHWNSGSLDSSRPLHESIGIVMADETLRQVGHAGKIAIITMDTRRAPELKVQMDAFQKHLRTSSTVAVADQVVLDPGDNPKYRIGSGLSAKRLLKIARKHGAVDALVSFVGMPELSEEELKQAGRIPAVIAETHSPERLVGLLQKKVLVSAIVPRYEFPAPGPRQPQTSRQWFDHYFQVVHAETLVPRGDDSP